ncbi:hypothetical protein CAI21_15490 [Alkalilimnicola ehrlichii]|uniref:Uncharacterized protein n=1 Tax=Alkalilimnicola ehrlichii TaxID=351052 RepID=A0A3E0WPZ2_9GAMM|nr:hypothetical protein [Alkalilimnicola ehrlichii]RFA26969.1 hypothetical protein CAI21_15490 [Alkalilimnicola ehrlichii]RFA34087.1 hypothetical protein CAL65_15625 [Alkalilimnicola ehrlichii]
MEPQENLVRRQYLVSKAQIAKVERLRKREGVGATEIVRRAIEAYDPDAKGANEAEVEAALNAMAEALRETCRELATLRERVVNGLSDEAREANRRQVADETRAYYAAHPEELEAISRLFE